MLGLWLNKVPQYTNIFTIWILFYSLINVLNNPVWSIALAAGKLKKYVTIGSGVFLMAFPISFFFLKLGYPPVSVFIILFCVRLTYLIVVLTIIKSYISYKYTDYFKYIIIPIFKVCIPSFALNYILKKIVPESIPYMFLFILISLIITFIFIWIFGLNKNEKEQIVKTIKTKIKK